MNLNNIEDTMSEDEQIDKMIDNLSKSKFRGSFHLNNRMKEYVQTKGMDTIIKHGYDFINERLKPAYPKNDGKQTPMRQVHPIFVAQHANGFCCRDCLMRIHKIPKGRELTEGEVDYIINFMKRWIEKERN